MMESILSKVSNYGEGNFDLTAILSIILWQFSVFLWKFDKS